MEAAQCLLISSGILGSFHLRDISFFYFLNLFKKIYFSWRLITLQYCGFCHTFAWISHGCTCVPHPDPSSYLPPPPIPQGSSQCTSPEHPVSCIEPELVICFTYDNIHISMLFSQIIPLSPSPTESKSLFLYLCLFCCLAYRAIVTIFLNSILYCIGVFLSDLLHSV